MGTTPINAFPYPEISEPADVPADIKELALALDPKVKARNFKVVAGSNGTPGPNGPGYSIVKASTGVWTVTFSPAMPTPLIVIATLIGTAQTATPFTAMVDQATMTPTLLTIRTFNGATLTDAGFNFIAIGGADT